jgi:hypothetical protein
MTEHEESAIKAAITEAMNLGQNWIIDRKFEYVWEAARAYEPPTVCGALLNPAFSCALSKGHDGDHCTKSNLDGGYIGWSREQEPEELCVECEQPMSYYLHSDNEGLATHAFISAKEATK